MWTVSYTHLDVYKRQLMDIPMVSTYINAYSESDYTREAVVEKIMGRSPFLGVSPVDPFCGMWDLPL